MNATRTGGLLAELLAGSAARAAALPAELLPRPGRPSFARALAGRERLCLIPEWKRASPSSGALAREDMLPTLQRYQHAGAAALSILTEPLHFRGSVDDLRAAADAADLPILRKDFVVHPRQVLEAAACGASAVLLIARCLERGQLHELLAACRDTATDALLECRDERELDLALAVDDALIGVNNRDLDTLAVDLGVAERLLARVPAHRIAVAESGYRRPADLRPLIGRCNAVLVGTALLQGGDAAAFAAAGRGARR
jgi:indole-3-glycerol phosphate synthase